VTGIGVRIKVARGAVLIKRGRDALADTNLDCKQDVYCTTVSYFVNIPFSGGFSNGKLM
jgi:hypothetical protein